MELIRKVTTLMAVSAQWAVSASVRQRRRSGEKVHVLFCLCDHYEPGTDGVTTDEGHRRVRRLLDTYPKVADAHRDSDGCPPKRTWFFPPHYHQEGWLRSLVALCEQNYGEIELHLHHGKHVPDTADNLRETIRRCITEYSEFGIFGTQHGVKKYGFIHGDWALDNSRRGKNCGVNDELTILVETGCYGDFTFPCFNEATPTQINSIFYAKDDRDRPKSHDRGRPVRVGETTSSDLMIIQGPRHPYFRGGKLRGLRLLGDVIDRTQRVTPERIDAWVRTGISVEGRESWVIIKTHTHGATEGDVVLGAEMDAMLGLLESKYRNNDQYSLHYVTARELYNIIKAAEAGEPESNPATFRDYAVLPPRYDPSVTTREASSTLRDLIARTYRG